jgi:hypothetical protein
MARLHTVNISANGDAGVLVKDEGSFGDMDECRVDSNKRQGIACESGAKMSVHTCRVGGNWMQGVAAGTGGEITAKSCLVEGNLLAGVGAYDHKSLITLTDCLVTLGAMSGITAQEGGTLVANQCNVTFNQNAGALAVHSGSRLKLVSCRVERNVVRPTMEVEGGEMIATDDCVYEHVDVNAIKKPGPDEGYTYEDTVHQRQAISHDDNGAETLPPDAGKVLNELVYTHVPDSHHHNDMDADYSRGSNNNTCSQTHNDSEALHTQNGAHNATDLKPKLTQVPSICPPANLLQGNKVKLQGKKEDLGMYPAKFHFDAEAILDENEVAIVVSMCVYVCVCVYIYICMCVWVFIRLSFILTLRRSQRCE